MNDNSQKWGRGGFDSHPKEERFINMLEFKALKESFNIGADIDDYCKKDKPYGYGVEDWNEIKEEFN